MLENRVTPVLANSTHGGGKNLYKVNCYLFDLKINKLPHIKNITYY